MTADEIAELRRVVTVKPLEWTAPTKPNGDCAYDHCIAQTEFGRIFLDWKSWKGREDGDGTDDGVSIYAHWDFEDGWIGCEYSLDAAKAKAQSFYEQRILSALTLASRAPDVGDEKPVAWRSRHVTYIDWYLTKYEPPREIGQKEALYTEDQVTRRCEQVKREAYAECLECQPSTAENPNEDAYQRGRFDGVMEFARKIAAKKALAEKKI